MIKSKVIGIGAYTKQLQKELTDYWVGVQTANLIDYAKTEIKKLGDKISSYNGAHGMDRTGNLLNSLCWGVTYDGKMIDNGFYREAVTHTYTNRWGQERGFGTQGGTSSYLHEYFPNDMEEVNGRQLAEEYLSEANGKANKWTLFFAVLAPYWGYWEGGFTHIKSGRRMQWQAMTYIFDDVRMDLKPAKTHLTVYRPKYSYRNRKYKNKTGVKKIGLMR